MTRYRDFSFPVSDCGCNPIPLSQLCCYETCLRNSEPTPGPGPAPEPAPGPAPGPAPEESPSAPEEPRSGCSAYLNSNSTEVIPPPDRESLKYVRLLNAYRVEQGWRALTWSDAIYRALYHQVVYNYNERSNQTHDSDLYSHMKFQLEYYGYHYAAHWGSNMSYTRDEDKPAEEVFADSRLNTWKERHIGKDEIAVANYKGYWMIIIGHRNNCVEGDSSTYTEAG